MKRYLESAASCLSLIGFAALSVPAACEAQTLTTLASFSETLHITGYGSFGSLIQGADGNFYGTTSIGGADAEGTAFQMTPAGTVTVLYSFGGTSNAPQSPYAGLIQATDGNFYGTTLNGGSNQDGTVFKLTPSGALTTLYSFGSGSSDGAQPSGQLIQATDGNFYGTTTHGGTANSGTVFKITPTGTLTVLFSFGTGGSTRPDGSSPTSALIQATDGNLYGTTTLGGAHNSGVVFRITLAGTLTVLHSFGYSASLPDGSEPNSGLVQATDGNLYGTTASGGVQDQGSIFRITPGGAETVLYSFAAGEGLTSGGGQFLPVGALIQATDGNLYGTTVLGGAHNNGTVFGITLAGTLTVIHSFGGTDGSLPYARLIQANDGNLYGTTLSGGAYGNGTVFRLALAAAALPAPSILSGGVVPVYSSTTTIQPGEWVSIYGTNLASGTVTWNGDFPISLGGTTVKINGKSAYLWLVSPGQINLQSPDDTATGSVPVVVTTGGGSVTSTVTLAQFAPAFLLLDSKHVTGIILRSDGSGAYGGGSYDIIGPTGTSLGYPTVAAKAGDSIELYGTGFGPTSPAVLAGQAYSGAAASASQVTLLVNNVGLTPSFAGLSGAGLEQINLTLPAGLGTGEVPLQATVGGAQTPAGVVISLQ